MAMNTQQKRMVNRLQSNLYTIRQLAGWSADDLGELLDLTKQTIYNLERGKPKMSLVQYLAIRTIIDDEICRQPDNKALSSAVALLLDDEELSDKEYDELQLSLKTITTGMARTTDREIALKLAMTTVSAVASFMAISTASGVGNWLTALREIADAKGK